jgi:hypothetical protein
MKSELDHVAHGWALLALRLPEIRAVSGHRQSIGEMCECYSIAVLQLRELRKQDSASECVVEYEQLVSGIEEEVAYYLARFARKAG